MLLLYRNMTYRLSEDIWQKLCAYSWYCLISQLPASSISRLLPLYNKYNQDDKKYDEFPKGIHAELYEKDGSMVGSITSKYAKKLEEEMLWELRNEVVVINAEGKKLETDLMYWDMKKEIVYSDRYSRLTSGDQIIEGNKGFKSDQSLKNPVFNKITGVVEIENKP